MPQCKECCCDLRDNYSRTVGRPSKYCSEECKASSRRRASAASKKRPKQFVCEKCGKSFTACLKRAFCSKECRYSPDSSGTQAECMRCGTSFKRKAAGQRFCSYACGRRRPKVYYCKNCGEKYTVKNRSRNAFKFCSRECAFEARRLKKSAAIRPIEVTKAIAKWFLSWGEDVWPRTGECALCKSAVTRRNGDDRVADLCNACHKPVRLCADCCGQAEKYSPFCLECTQRRMRASRRSARKSRRRKNGHEGTHRRRCRKYGAPYTPVKKSDVFSRDKWRCKLCGVKLLRKHETILGTNTPHPRCPTIDHIVPLCHGADSPGHCIENLQACCWECNTLKSAEDNDSFAASLATRVH